MYLMQENQLTAKSGTGTQSTTSSPQQSSGTSGAAANGRGVQPGTTASLLTNKTAGVKLNSTSLTVVNIGPKTASVVKTPAPAKASPSPIAIDFAVILFVLAGIMLWSTIKAGKKTT
jgi:hypothetical protein